MVHGIRVFYDSLIECMTLDAKIREDLKAEQVKTAVRCAKLIFDA